MISHRYRCIFIHIPKTGGTSVENVIWPPAENRSAQDLWMGFVDRYHNKYQTGGLQHLLARHVLREVGPEIFNSYFRFTIVRNPWDRVISQYVHMSKRQDLRDFIGMQTGDPLNRYLQLIQQKKHTQWEPQMSFVVDANGKPLVDFIGRFETFQQSLQQVLLQLGISLRTIPHEKRGERGPYQDYYDAETRDMVATMYAEDIAAFGYSFADARAGVEADAPAFTWTSAWSGRYAPEAE